MGALGKGAEAASKFAHAHPAVTAGGAGYFTGKSVQKHKQRKAIRQHMKLMTATQMKYRAQDKHPQGGYYG